MNKLRNFLLFCLIALISACESESDIAVENGFWEVVDPTEVSLDNGRLETLTADLEAENLGLVSSLLLVKDGKLAYEYYGLGMNVDQLHVNYSITKSITSALVGIAHKEGLLDNIDQPILPFVNTFNSIGNENEWKRSITIEQVLQMRSGIEWDEVTHNYGSPQNSTTGLINSTDWIKHVLDKPMAEAPGLSYNYNSGCTILLSGLIESVSGRSAEEYAQQQLFSQLGIKKYDWQNGSNGLTNTGFGLSLRPRDMAKFGLLYLNEGQWQGNQIIDKDWIQRSWTPYSQFENGFGYGYQWKMFPFTIRGNTVPVPYANGHGNQYIFVVKELDLIVVITSENFDRQPSFIGKILTEYVFASAE